MKKLGFLLILMGFLCFLASPSHASFSTTWTDSHYELPWVYMDEGDVHSYTHDIKTDNPAFRPLKDYVSDWSLELRFVDDQWRDGDEYVTVKTGWFDFPTFDTKYEVSSWNLLFPITDEEWTFSGWLSLNALGLLDVDLKAYEGDFKFVASKIYARGISVPEPGTMLLLGCSLLGLAGIGRKKFFKK